MGNLLHDYGTYLVIAVAVVLLLFFGKFVLLLFGIVMVPDDSVASITKKFVVTNRDKQLPDGRIIALKGEPGIQADTLPPGLYFGYFPWQYSVKLLKFLTVPQDKVGIVEARDGDPIPAGRILAKAVDCDSFQNARAFLENGGQRGPQIGIIRPGTYRINTDLFEVKLYDVLQIPDSKVGVVTTLDGRPLDTGEIAGPVIAGHHRFEDGQAFVDGGGYKGLQEEVMLAGTYYLNPLFARVAMRDLIQVPIGHVGVVVSFVGESASVPDATLQPGEGPRAGESPKHGRIVERGQKGVWREPLDPGRYPINPETHVVEIVPTTNIVLNWAEAKTEAHNLDRNLSTIKVQSKDGFAFNLDVSQIIHIPRDFAARVISRFGSMQNLVTQVLEPLIGNYFRNSAQASDAIDFLMERTARQEEAGNKIRDAIKAHDVEAVDTLIGDINPPEELMKTLTDQKVAERQVATFKKQQEAQEARQELERAQAEADTRATVVQASRDVEVAEFAAQTAIKKAEGEAGAKRKNADADAYVAETVGKAEAERINAVGSAEAQVQKAKVESIGADAYARIQVAGELARNGIKLVPEILVAGSGDGRGGTVLDGLLALNLKEQLDGRGVQSAPTPAAASSGRADGATAG